MAGYTNIRNSAANANSNYFTTAGVAIGASNQPNIDDTVIAGTPDSALGKDMYGFVSKSFPVAYTGNDRTQIMMGSVNTIRNVSSNVLRDPGAQPPTAISIPQGTALRTVKVTTAVRAGAWNEISGFFATSGGPEVQLAVSNDFSAVGNDDEADSVRSAPGLFAFLANGALPTQSGYPARTQ